MYSQSRCPPSPSTTRPRDKMIDHDYTTTIEGARYGDERPTGSNDMHVGGADQFRAAGRNRTGGSRHGIFRAAGGDVAPRRLRATLHRGSDGTDLDRR